MKVETTTTDGHSSVPGAATGSGGEIRDEGAPDVAQAESWSVRFSVSNLRIPASNSRGEEISVNLSALLPRWTS
ncbi:hypothetical protein ACNKHN_14840 [Shigella flexneri]